MNEKFYVRVDRSDGSRTYKGAWTKEHAQREADAWTDAFPNYGISLVPTSDETVRGDVRLWQQHVNHGQSTRITSSYFPRHEEK